MNNKKIILQAAAFCYGPISTSLSVASFLREMGCNLTWIASGTSLELLNEGFYPDVIQDIDDLNENDLVSLFESADCIVINTDPEFAELVSRNGFRYVYLDILYWMWDKLPVSVFNEGNFYIYEDFYTCKNQEKRIGLPQNCLKVGPLLPPNCFEDKKKHYKNNSLLINIGGVNRPIVCDKSFLNKYVLTIYDMIIEIVKTEDLFSEVHCYGGNLPINKKSIKGIQFYSGRRKKEELIEIMKYSDTVLISPGLTSFFESVILRKAFYILPPTNYSQFLQFYEYSKRIDNKCYCPLKDLNIDAPIDKYLNEEKALQEIDRLLPEILKNQEKLYESIKIYLRDYKSINYPNPANLLAGIEDNQGAEKAAKAIVEFISKK